MILPKPSGRIKHQALQEFATLMGSGQWQSITRAPSSGRTGQDSLLLVWLNHGSTPHATSAACSNETNLLTRRAITAHRGGMTDVLMVTTTVGMLHRVHGHTTNHRPAVTLSLVLVVGNAGLKQGLLSASSSSNLSNGGTRSAGDDLLGARGELDSGHSGVWVVRHDEGVVARGTSDGAAVTKLLLHAADDGSFGHLTDGHNIADVEAGLLATVDELAGVGSLSGDEQLLLVPVLHRVAEGDLGKGGATGGIVDDISNNALDIPIALSSVEFAVLGGSLAVSAVGLEHAPSSTLTLSPDNAAHDVKKGGKGVACTAAVD